MDIRSFKKHYINPLFQRGEYYNPKEYFTAWYESVRGMSDGETISKSKDPIRTRFHYNTVENSILSYFRGHGLNEPRVLDIGVGAGHWIDFYLEVFNAREVVGLDIAPPLVRRLKRRYEGEGRVRILEGDISETK